VGTSLTAVVKVKHKAYGMCIFSRARPKSSGEVVIKKNEKDVIRSRNLTIIVKENVRVDPVKRFAIKINTAKKEPALIEETHLFTDLAIITIGN